MASIEYLMRDVMVRAYLYWDSIKPNQPPPPRMSIIQVYWGDTNITDAIIFQEKIYKNCYLDFINDCLQEARENPNLFNDQYESWWLVGENPLQLMMKIDLYVSAEADYDEGTLLNKTLKIYLPLPGLMLRKEGSPVAIYISPDLISHHHMNNILIALQEDNDNYEYRPEYNSEDDPRKNRRKENES